MIVVSTPKTPRTPQSKDKRKPLLSLSFSYFCCVCLMFCAAYSFMFSSLKLRIPIKPTPWFKSQPDSRHVRIPDDANLSGVRTHHMRRAALTRILSSDTIQSDVEPSVCICTPFMNVAPDAFLETAHSVLNQTLRHFEWIIVDDFSDDPASLAVLTKVAAKDRRVRIVTPEKHLQQLPDHVPSLNAHVGLGNARKVGLIECSGEFILYLDGDDLIDPTAAEKFLWYLHTHPQAHFVSSFVVGFGAQSYLWERGFQPSWHFKERNDAVSIAMHRVQSLRKVGHSGRRMGLEDWDTWLRYANVSMWGSTIPEFLVYYRRRQRHDDRWVALSNTALEEFKASIPSRFPALQDNAAWPAAPRVSVSTFSLDPPRVLPLGVWQPNGRPRILMILPWMVLGGPDKFNLDFVRYFTGSGWSITIATTIASHNMWIEEFQQYTDDIFVLPTLMPATSFLEAVHNIIISRVVDVVWISHCQYASFMLPYLTAAHPHVVFADYTHMEDPHWRNGGHARFSVSMQPLLDVAFVSSQHLKEWMVANGGLETKISVRYTSIDTDVWKPDLGRRREYREVLKIPRDAFVVLYACRFEKQKQPFIFSDIVKRMLREGNPGASKTHFIIGGAGPLQDAMLRELEKVPDYFRENLHWLGPIAPDRMFDVLSSSDVLLLPSMMEGIPLIFFEAMSLGTVIVSSDVGGIKEIVKSGQTGYLVPLVDSLGSKNEEQLDTYTSILTTLRADTALLKTLAENSISFISQFKQREMFNGLAQTLRELISRRSSEASAWTRIPGLRRQPEATDKDLLYALVDTYRWAVRAEEGEVVEHV